MAANPMEEFKRLARGQGVNTFAGNTVTMTSAVPASYMAASSVQ